MNTSKFLVGIAVALLTAGAIAQDSQAQGQGRRGFGQFGRGAGFGGGITSLLMREEVQAELKLTQEQKDKVAALRPQRGERRAAGGGFGGAGGGQAGGGQGAGGQAGGGRREGRQGFDPAAMRQRMEEQDKAALSILDSNQQTRAKELLIQRLGNSAIIREDVQKELNLTSTQKTQIEDLQTKQREASMALMEKARSGNLEQDQIREAMRKNNEILQAELGKVLTSDQAAKLKSMGGAPFKFKGNDR